MQSQNHPCHLTTDSHAQLSLNSRAVESDFVQMIYALWVTVSITNSNLHHPCAIDKIYDKKDLNEFIRCHWFERQLQCNFKLILCFARTSVSEQLTFKGKFKHQQWQTILCFVQGYWQWWIPYYNKQHKKTHWEKNKKKIVLFVIFSFFCFLHNIFWSGCCFNCNYTGIILIYILYHKY